MGAADRQRRHLSRQVCRLVLGPGRGVLRRERAGRWGRPHRRPGRVGRGAVLLLQALGLAGPPARVLPRAARLRPAGDPDERGHQLREGRPAGPLGLAHHLRLGHPRPRRPGPRHVCLAGRARQLHLGPGLPRHRGRALPHLLAREFPRRRQGHPALPRRLLAGLPDERRPRAAEAGLRPWLVDGRGPEDVQVLGQRGEPGLADREVRPGPDPLLPPARDRLRQRRRFQPRRHGPPHQPRPRQRLRQSRPARALDDRQELRRRRA